MSLSLWVSVLSQGVGVWAMHLSIMDPHSWPPALSLPGAFFALPLGQGGQPWATGWGPHGVDKAAGKPVPGGGALRLWGAGPGVHPA